MNRPKFTQGDWRMDPDNCNVYSDGLLAQVHGHTHLGERRANGLLIAAAPDLLAVVQLIVKEWEAPTDGTTRGELIGRLSQYTSEAYAALKKAGVIS